MSTENMCKKKQYATEAEAVAFSESWAIKHPNSVRQHPYRCEDCNNCYHLTTEPRESGERGIDSRIAAGADL